MHECHFLQKAKVVSMHTVPLSRRSIERESGLTAPSVARSGVCSEDASLHNESSSDLVHRGLRSALLIRCLMRKSLAIETQNQAACCFTRIAMEPGCKGSLYGSVRAGTASFEMQILGNLPDMEAFWILFGINGGITVGKRLPKPSRLV